METRMIAASQHLHAQVIWDHFLPRKQEESKKLEPQINTDERRWNEISQGIIGCAYTVSNSLGCGFLEKVYENSPVLELRHAGFEVEQQKGITVHYRGAVVGEYVADLLVAGTILVELKAVRALDEIHVAQCLNYLKATNYPICLLLNFGQPRVEVKRLRNKSYLRSSAFICGSNNA
jgi:GxxExxY protein